MVYDFHVLYGSCVLTRLRGAAGAKTKPKTPFWKTVVISGMLLFPIVWADACGCVPSTRALTLRWSGSFGIVLLRGDDVPYGHGKSEASGPRSVSG